MGTSNNKLLFTYLVCVVTKKNITNKKMSCQTGLHFWLNPKTKQKDQGCSTRRPITIHNQKRMKLTPSSLKQHSFFHDYSSMGPRLRC